MNLLLPDWPAPANVRAATSTRQGGVSQPPFDSFNLGGHVGDDPAAVAANRKKLGEVLALPNAPYWLSQVHGTTVVSLDGEPGGLPEGDASTTTQANTVCAVLTADCLPVLFCDRQGTQVAAAHAGWRGLAAGVLEATVASFNTAPENLIAWLGPAIGPQVFEVGDEVRQAFCQIEPRAAAAFMAIDSDANEKKWLADVYQLARQRLVSVGVENVYGGGRCTFTEAETFYSFRRDSNTGRMVSLIWFEREA